MTRFKGKNKVKWYSITEQTPTDTGYYLVCYDNSLPTHSRYSIAQWLHSENDWSFTTQNKAHISYWTHLPDPPEGFFEEW